jgi:transposase-like protein
VDLVEAGRKVTDVARDLGVSNLTIYTWRRRELIDRGLVAGRSSLERRAGRRQAPDPRVGG